MNTCERDIADRLGLRSVIYPVFTGHMVTVWEWPFPRSCSSLPFTLLLWDFQSWSQCQPTTPVSNLLPAHFEITISTLGAGLVKAYDFRLLSVSTSGCPVLPNFWQWELPDPGGRKIADWRLGQRHNETRLEYSSFYPRDATLANPRYGTCTSRPHVPCSTVTESVYLRR